MGHGSNDVTVAAALLRVPSATAFDYEWATVQHNVNCRLARAVVVPDAIPPERLDRYGAKRQGPPLRGAEGGVLPGRLRARPGRARASWAWMTPQPIVVVRTPPEVSLYHRFENPLFRAVLERAEGRRAGRGAAAHARSAGRDSGARRPDRARARDRRPEPDRAGGPRDLRRRYHEPRGGGARHPRLHHFRGPSGRRRRAVAARRAPAQARGSRPGAASRSAPCTTPTASAATPAKW